MKDTKMRMIDEITECEKAILTYTKHLSEKYDEDYDATLSTLIYGLDRLICKMRDITLEELHSERQSLHNLAKRRRQR